MNIQVISGTTIRITATFTNFQGEPTDPDIVKFITYDSDYKVIDEYGLTEDNRATEGIYFYDLHIPEEPKHNTMYYGFYGEIAGNPSINRGKIDVAFYKR